MISNRQAAFNVLRRMQPGDIFTGPELSKRVKAITGKQSMIATSIRALREYRDLYGVDIVCVNSDKSIYKIVG